MFVSTRIEDLFSNKTLLKEIEEVSSMVQFDADTEIVTYHQYPKAIPIVVEGLVKVLREDNDGGQLFLYYINHNETCAMTLKCALTSAASSIKAVTVQSSKIVLIPVQYSNEWMVTYPEWNTFIINSLSYRFEEVLLTLDEVMFKKLDDRLFKYLQEKSLHFETKILQISHQEIADDLHSSREVISRILKQLEKREILVLGRGKITLM